MSFGSKVRRVGAGLLVALVATLGASALQAQEAATPPEMPPADEDAPKPWSNEAELSYVKTGGNTSASTFALSNRFAYNFTYSEFLLTADLLRASTTRRTVTNVDGGVAIDEESEPSAERYEVSAAYRQNILDEMFWYARAGWYRNPFSGVDARFTGGGGVGYRFVETEQTLFVGELGLAVTNEALVDADGETFIDLRGALESRFTITDTTDFNFLVEAWDDLQNTSNLRLKLDTSITTAISNVFALRVGYLLDFRNEPVTQIIDVNPDAPPAPFTFGKTDSTIGVSLVVKL